jgi:uncharacterized protein (TIGR03435 family)
MLSKLGRVMRLMLTALPVAVLFPAAAFGQSPKSQPSFDAVDVHASNSTDQWVSIGVLPDGHVRSHNASLRMLIVAAYGVDADRVTGGPIWLDSEHFDIDARTAPTSSRESLLLKMQALLADRFKLIIHHDKKVVQDFTLKVGPGGPKLQPASKTEEGCAPVDGVPRQLHLACHALTMNDLAEQLSQFAGGYVTLPAVNLTGLTDAYDFQLDWMGRRPYDAAIANAAAGAAKDPLAVSIFDAVAKLGLLLEKRDNPQDVIVVESVERAPTSNAASGSVASSPAADLKSEQVAAIDGFVTAEMSREHIPGLAVGIYSRGQILLAKGYGLANVELNVPVKPETIFQSGSVGKQFASAAIMTLVEEGKIGLDDSIVKYFPNAPESWKPILVKNLLSHTSGLAEYESPERTGPKGPFYLRLDFTEDQIVEKIEALPIEFKPGEKWNYRNTNYVLLGVMIHKVAGKFFADYMQDRIFKPWNMTSTRLISEADIIPNRSSGYELRGGKLRNQDWVSPTFNSTADGTLYYNVLDLAKWDEALYGTSLLKQSSLDRIWTVYPLNDGNPNPANYGFGWIISKVNGHKVIEHGGAWQGFTCSIVRVPDDNLTVVVLTNLAGANPAQIAHRVSEIANPALKPPPPKERKEITIDPKLFDAYVGRYELAPNVIFTVTRTENHFFAQLTGQDRLEVFPETTHDFFLKILDAQLTFVTDSQGRATELILHQNERDQHAKRIE